MIDSFRENQVYAIARATVAFIWIWHGVVPKLIAQDPVEASPLLTLGLDSQTTWTIVKATGVGEIIFGLLILVLWRQRWPLLLTIVAMGGLLLGVFVTSTELVLGAFNPVTLNLAVIALAAIAWYSSER